MRTTLTLDDDVAAALERLHRARDGSYKELVNETLRLGLKKMEATGRRPRPPVRTRSVSLGPCRIGSLDNIAEALAVGDGEAFR